MGNCFRRNRGGSDSDYKATFSGGNIHVIDSQENWDFKISEANKEGKIVVANFSASWCGPCRMITPLYSGLSLKYPQLVFLTIDVDELMDLSSSWDIHATPTFFFLKQGKQIDKLVGANKPELEKKVLTHAESEGPRACDALHLDACVAIVRKNSFVIFVLKFFGSKSWPIHSQMRF